MTSMAGEEGKLLDLDIRVCGWLAVCMYTVFQFYVCIKGGD